MEDGKGEQSVKVFRRRWLMLGIFMLFAVANNWQWIQYTIISNVVVKYYDVDQYAVDWTSIIFFLLYVLLIIPASALMNKKGLRPAVLLGTLTTMIGSWLKVASLPRNLFWVAFVGQSFVAVGQVFMLGVPPQLASVWFPTRHVSTACALGIIGTQIGVALGMVLTPIMVKLHDDLGETAEDFQIMYYELAAFSTLACVLAVFLFQNEPPCPPSDEMLERNSLPTEFWIPVKNLLRSRSYLLIVLTYSASVGVANCVGTMMNTLILNYFEHGEELAGRTGMTTVLGGITGMVVGGLILDFTRRFKETAVATYFLTFLSILAMIFILRSKSEVALYFGAFFYGFFLNGYLPVGFEFASEVTYPASENLSSNLLMFAAQLISTLMTMGYGPLIRLVGDLWANVTLSAILFVSCLITMCIPGELKRQNAHKAALQQRDQ